MFLARDLSGCFSFVERNFVAYEIIDTLLRIGIRLRNRLDLVQSTSKYYRSNLPGRAPSGPEWSQTRKLAGPGEVRCPGYPPGCCPWMPDLHWLTCLILLPPACSWGSLPPTPHMVAAAPRALNPQVTGCEDCHLPDQLHSQPLDVCGQGSLD